MKDYLNIHEKIDLFINLLKILNYNNNTHIPELFLTQMYFVLNNIDFLNWMNIDEKINIFENISWILIKLKKNNRLNFIDDDKLLYNILTYENECFNIINKILKKNINFSNYNLAKTSIYSLITNINIFIDIQDYYFDNIKNKYIKHLFYKSKSKLVNYIKLYI
jgi:hypothetical protein